MYVCVSYAKGAQSNVPYAGKMYVKRTHISIMLMARSAAVIVYNVARFVGRTQIKNTVKTHKGEILAINVLASQLLSLIVKPIFFEPIFSFKYILALGKT